MKAPDRLEMTICGFSDIGLLDVEEEGKESIDYIRKDALLKWLEYKKEWFGGTGIESHYQKVIDKVKSM